MATAPPNGDAWKDPVVVGTREKTIYMQNKLHGRLSGIYVTNTTASPIAITLRVTPRGSVASSAYDLLSGKVILANDLYSWEGRVPYENGDELTVFASAPGLNLRVVVEEEI